MTVRQIYVPEFVRKVCMDWYDGSGSMMYAVASTGGLTLGTVRPRWGDCAEKWHYGLFEDLRVELEYAARYADEDGAGCTDELDRAVEWASHVCNELWDCYGGDDWGDNWAEV